MGVKRILMGNLGYARGINGSLAHHLRYAHRHIWAPQKVQEKSLKQIRDLIAREDPDLCCFVEIDKGSFGTPRFNQLEALLADRYHFYDIENKYGLTSTLRHFPITKGKSNGFMAKNELAYERLYFTHGTKKLIYKITLAPDFTVFFAHFSLKRNVRLLQLEQVKEILTQTPGQHIFLGDFNIHTGFGELMPLLAADNLVVLNREDMPTFTFHRRQLVLDLCICSKALKDKIDLTVVPQPYSDHAALLLELKEH